MNISIKKAYDHELPVPCQAKEGDAGFDLRSMFDGVVAKGDLKLIPTGFAWEIPEGYVGIVKARSGLAIEFGINVRAGVIDSSYRGEIMVAIVPEDRGVYIDRGQRIAQLVIVPYLSAQCVLVDDLTQSERGSGGFGSTGVK